MSERIQYEMDDACFARYQELVHELAGITIRAERKSMLVSRLRRRVRALNLEGFEEYLVYLGKNTVEHEHFVNQMTTNETYFFRTPRVWEYIEDTFLPEWLEGHPNSRLEVWSAASSTGEEAHTLGILMQKFKDANAGFDYKIQGTDIDTNVVAKATIGLYNDRSIDRFRKARPVCFESYMVGNDTDGYRVLPDIKKRISFSSLNLFDANARTQKYDLVLVRNVLIYFAAPDQEKVMSTIRRNMHSEGIAVIGESESLNSLQTDFESIGHTLYKAKSRSQRKAA